MKRIFTFILITISLMVIAGCDVEGVTEVMESIESFLTTDGDECIENVYYVFETEDREEVNATITFDHCLEYDFQKNQAILDTFIDSDLRVVFMMIEGENNYQYVEVTEVE